MTYGMYCKSKKYCSFSISGNALKIGQDFLDILYVGLNFND